MVATPSTAEQFLASQGIKFRVVAAKRGPGEWNVTFSRKGGGRLKLDFEQTDKPSLSEVLTWAVMTYPNREEYPEGFEESYKADLLEFGRVSDFFTTHEIRVLTRGQG